MAKGSNRSGGRDRRSIATRSPRAPRVPPASQFSAAWLRTIRENPGIRLVDLMRYEDRRRFSPETVGRFPRPEVATARGWLGKPRIVIVPEGHELSKYQTYGGKYSLREVWHGHTYTRGMYYADETDPEGRKRNRLHGAVSARLGFHAPWQVVVCVRRKRRRNVLFANRIAGRSGVGRGKQWRRNYYSQVRC